VKRDKRWGGYILVPLEKEVVEAIDEAARQLGITRTNLARFLVLSYFAQLQLQHPAVALFTAAQRANEVISSLTEEEKLKLTRGEELQAVKTVEKR